MFKGEKDPAARGSQKQRGERPLSVPNPPGLRCVRSRLITGGGGTGGRSQLAGFKSRPTATKSERSHQRPPIILLVSRCPGTQGRALVIGPNDYQSGVRPSPLCSPGRYLQQVENGGLSCILQSHDNDFVLWRHPGEGQGQS